MNQSTVIIAGAAYSSLIGKDAIKEFLHLADVPAFDKYQTKTLYSDVLFLDDLEVKRNSKVLSTSGSAEFKVPHTMINNNFNVKIIFNESKSNTYEVIKKLIAIEKRRNKDDIRYHFILRTMYILEVKLFRNTKTGKKNFLSPIDDVFVIISDHTSGFTLQDLFGLYDIQNRNTIIRLYVAQLLCAIEILEELGIDHGNLQSSSILLLKRNDIEVELSAYEAKCQHKNNLFSLGLTIFQLYTGTVPFSDSEIIKRCINNRPIKLAFDDAVPKDAQLIIETLIHSNKKIADIKKDKYFKGIDWSTLHDKKLVKNYVKCDKTLRQKKIETFNVIIFLNQGIANEIS